MFWLGALVLSQAVQPVDPLTSLLQSPNPGVVAFGLLVVGLFGADKVAFWYTKLKGKLPTASLTQQDSKSMEALVDTQRDLTATVTDISKTVDKLEEYCQRHFEQTGLELRSVREELRAIRERLERPDGQPPR
jgi:hypothetical protein